MVKVRIDTRAELETARNAVLNMRESGSLYMRPKVSCSSGVGYSSHLNADRGQATREGTDNAHGDAPHVTTELRRYWRMIYH